MTLTYDQIAEEVTDVIMSHQKAPQPCGHHRGCFKTARDGTEHCVACEAAAKTLEAAAVERELLEYVYEQTLGDLISPGIKDDAMMRVYLSVGMLRRIAAIRARGEEQQC